MDITKEARVRRWIGAACVGVCLMTSGGAWAQAEQGAAVEVDVATSVSAEKAGRAQLAGLSKEKTAAYRLEGEERRAALLAVAARYEATANDVALRGAERSEAAFRAGEVFRTARELGAAARAFGAATTLGLGNEGEIFAARAWLEQGHMARRDKQYARAQELYTTVTDRFAAHARPAAHAWTWRSKVAIQQKQWGSAGEAVRAFLASYSGVYPVEGIRNAERLARELRSQGHESDADALKIDVEAKIGASEADWAEDREAVEEALGDFRVTFIEETR